MGGLWHGFNHLSTPEWTPGAWTAPRSRSSAAAPAAPWRWPGRRRRPRRGCATAPGVRWAGVNPWRIRMYAIYLSTFTINIPHINVSINLPLTYGSVMGKVVTYLPQLNIQSYIILPQSTFTHLTRQKNWCHSQITTEHRHLSIHVRIVSMKFLCGL